MLNFKKRVIFCQKFFDLLRKQIKMNYWLIKSEPSAYSWNQFLQDGSTFWSGVRNYQARNNLRAMKIGDLALFYHSNDGKSVMGVAEIIKDAYQDPTTDETAWVVVDVKPLLTLQKPVTLAAIKLDERLQKIALIRQTQLSVMPIQREEFDVILELGEGVA